MSLPDYLSRPAVMGVLNVTPDSFSDGGDFLSPQAAVAHALKMDGEGAGIIDVGGESTRPGSEPVSEEEELRRVEPVISELKGRLRAAISIDTSKVVVASAAVAAGAELVNDITALRGDPRLASLCAVTGVYVCLTHMQGTPREMQVDPTYDDVVSEVKSFLTERLEFAVKEGISEDRILLDPGIGFGKRVEHNLKLLGRLGELAELGRPLVVGASRKSFLGELTGRDASERVAGTVAANIAAYYGGAHIFRVHDVAAHVDAFKVIGAVGSAGREARATAHAG